MRVIREIIVSEIRSRSPLKFGPPSGRVPDLTANNFGMELDIVSSTGRGRVEYCATLPIIDRRCWGSEERRSYKLINYAYNYFRSNPKIDEQTDGRTDNLLRWQCRGMHHVHCVTKAM